MTVPTELRIVEMDPEDRGGEANSAEPTVFVRTIAAPPGAPWDQVRVAGLEARVGAPLPLAEVVYQLKRLEPWSFGRPGRFAACYVRASEVGEDFSTIKEIDGRPVAIRFLSVVERRRRLQSQVFVTGAIAATTAFILAALASALAVRSDLDRRQAVLLQETAFQLRQAQAEHRLQEQDLALARAHVAGHTIGDVMSDLAWASANKTAGAHIDALHWQDGVMGVETRGELQPFANGERAVIKVERPLRPGVWLWGVAPANHVRQGGLAAEAHR
jgi:hypothetical protein